MYKLILFLLLLLVSVNGVFVWQTWEKKQQKFICGSDAISAVLPTADGGTLMLSKAFVLIK